MRTLAALAVADDLAVRAHPRRDGLEPVHCLTTLLQHLLRGAVIDDEFLRDAILRSGRQPPSLVGSGYSPCVALSVRKCEGGERSSAFAALAIEDVQPGRVDMHGSDVSRRAGVLRQGVLCQ